MGRRWCGQVMCGNGQGMAGLTGVGAVAEERRDSDFVGLVEEEEEDTYKKLIPPTSPFAPNPSCAFLFVYRISCMGALGEYRVDLFPFANYE